MLTILMFNMEEGEFRSFQELCAQIGHIPVSAAILRGEGHPLYRLEEMLSPGMECLKNMLQTQPIEQTEPTELKEPDVKTGHCRIRTAKKYYDIPYDAILFIECECKKSVIHTRQGKITVPMPLYRIKQDLPSDIFIQTHRSFIVHIENILSIDKTGESWEIAFAGIAEKALISRTYRKDFLHCMEEFLRD